MTQIARSQIDLEIILSLNTNAQIEWEALLWFLVQLNASYCIRIS